MKSKELQENRIGPVNPFALGNVFIEAAKKLGWMVEEQVERQRRYYITPQGFAEMEKLGLELQRVLHYRPMTPLPENAPSRHERPMPPPGSPPARPMHSRPQHSRHQGQLPNRQEDQQHNRQEGQQHDRQHSRPHDRQRGRHPDRHRH